MPVNKKKRHRRPARTRKLGTARRFIHTLPKPVEDLPAVQHAADYIDDREAEARRTALEIEKAARAQLVQVVKYCDLWLEKVGLMRLAAHRAELQRLRAKKRSTTATKKRPATKPSAARASGRTTA